MRNGIAPCIAIHEAFCIEARTKDDKFFLFESRKDIDEERLITLLWIRAAQAVHLDKGHVTFMCRTDGHHCGHLPHLRPEIIPDFPQFIRLFFQLIALEELFVFQDVMFLQDTGKEIHHPDHDHVSRTILHHEFLVKKDEISIHRKCIDWHKIEIATRQHDAMAIAIALRHMIRGSKNAVSEMIDRCKNSPTIPRLYELLKPDLRCRRIDEWHLIYIARNAIFDCLDPMRTEVLMMRCDFLQARLSLWVCRPLLHALSPAVRVTMNHGQKRILWPTVKRRRHMQHIGKLSIQRALDEIGICRRMEHAFFNKRLIKPLLCQKYMLRSMIRWKESIRQRLVWQKALCIHHHRMFEIRQH